MKTIVLVLFTSLLGTICFAQDSQNNEPYKISHNLLSDETVSSELFSSRPIIRMSPDGQGIIYAVTQNDKITSIYFGSTTTPEETVKIADINSDETVLDDFVFCDTCDSRILYFTEKNGSDDLRMYTAATDGSGAMFIDEVPSMARFSSVLRSGQVFYLDEVVENDLDEVVEDGSTLIGLFDFRFNESLKVRIDNKDIVPDSIIRGQYVTGGDDLRGASYVYLTEGGRLYLADLAGLGSILLNDRNPDNNNTPYHISPNGGSVAYASKVDEVFIEPEVTETEYSLNVNVSKVDPFGSAIRVIQSRGVFRDFKYSPDGKNIAYLSGTVGGGLDSLDVYNYSIDTNSSVKLNHKSGAGISIQQFDFSNDSSRLYYTLSGSSDTDDNGLFSVTINGENVKRLSRLGDQSVFVSAYNVDTGDIAFSTFTGVIGRINPLSNNISGGQFKKLATDFYQNSFPISLSTQDRRAIFVSKSDDGLFLNVIPLKGNGQETRINLFPESSSNELDADALSFYTLSDQTNRIIYYGNFDNADKAEIFGLDLSKVILDVNEEVCFPVKAKNGNQATVCL